MISVSFIAGCLYSFVQFNGCFSLPQAVKKTERSLCLPRFLTTAFLISLNIDINDPIFQAL